jgi:hypothetical protein
MEKARELSGKFHMGSLICYLHQQQAYYMFDQQMNYDPNLS